MTQQLKSEISLQTLNEKLDEYCSRYYRFSDLFHCGETWHKTKCDNLPMQTQSWEAYKKLAQEILDPITNHFGPVQLTFGFCGQQLRSLIRKNPSPRIAPTLDQHAAYERNTKGKPICPRLGAAIDLRVNNTSSQAVAIWAASYLPFDRLYFYGDDKPIHVSIGPENSSQIVWLNTINNRRIPKKLTLDALITLPKK